MLSIYAEVWVHSNAETGEPFEVCINKISSKSFVPCDLIRFFIDYDFTDSIEEFDFLQLDNWHIVELFFDHEDEWYFAGAENTEQQVQADSLDAHSLT